ncbi:hypothetical protein PF008_g4373 [Phytophthora fragariae]|uniref:Uncharacterized protein n=1 Tax=Phytophthora fragariae TaxID=53985 RepID=A0A6G0SCI9_9STRA|nr:hypothetical protein PF008_g4373 [Phytophthora fragariae]
MLLSLPPPILVAIIQYAVDGLQPDLGPHKRVLPVKRLQELALVCKATHSLLAKMTETLQNEYFYQGLEDFAGPEDIEDILEEINEYGAPVRDFRLRLGPYEPSLGVHDPRHFHFREPEPGELDQLNIDWDTMFSYMPGLKRLDLTEVSLLSRHIPQILEVVSKSCQNLEILILPSKNDFFGSVKEVVVNRLLVALIPALEKWYLVSGGLRQLTMASCEQEENLRCSQQYVEAVARFCPRIEYVDGYGQALNSEKEPCSNMWSISLETWQAFNASCTSLRAFNWTVVPFGDPFFRVFGEYVKPQLTSLSFSANMRWGYDYYLRRFPGSVVRVDENVSHPGYGTSAANPGDALRACPALMKLYIEIDHYTNEESHERYVDPFVYGDEFWEAVAQYCPLLEAIEMLDSSDQPLYNMRPIDTMTSRTLVALADLKWLRQCTIGPARLADNDIFEYLCRASSTGGHVAEREFNISIGGHESNRLAKFYAVVVVFLKLLAETSEETLGAASCSMKPHLHITNPYNSKVRQIWAEGYMRDELKPVLAVVREKHPSMAIEVSIGGRNGNKFNLIRGLSLTWRSRSRRRTLFRDIDGETTGRDSDSDVSIYSGGGSDDSMGDSEDENMEEN